MQRQRHRRQRLRQRRGRHDEGGGIRSGTRKAHLAHNGVAVNAETMGTVMVVARASVIGGSAKFRCDSRRICQDNRRVVGHNGFAEGENELGDMAHGRALRGSRALQIAVRVCDRGTSKSEGETGNQRGNDDLALVVSGNNPRVRREGRVFAPC